MSEYIDKKSESLVVIPEHSGKYQFFKVIGKNVHEVRIQIVCDCMSEVFTTGKLCAHKLAVIKKVATDGKFDNEQQNKPSA